MTKSRYVFYIDVGNLPTSKAEAFVAKIRRNLKKTKFWDKNTKVAYIAVRDRPTEFVRLG